MAVQLRQPEPARDLSQELAPIVRRLRLARCVKWGARGLLCGIALSLAISGASHLEFFPDWLPLEAVIPIALLTGLGAGVLPALRRPESFMQAARYADARLDLKERISSALDLGAAQQGSGDAALLRRMQYEDAAGYARALNPREVAPIPFTWEIAASIGGLLLLLLVLVLPALPVFTPPALRVERAIVQKEGEKLIKTAKVIEKQAETQSSPQTRQAARSLQSLGSQMARGKMDKKQAMVRMSRLSHQLQSKAGQTNADGDVESKSLPEAGRRLSQETAQEGAAATPEVRRSAAAMQQQAAQDLSSSLNQLADRVQSGRMAPSQQRQAARDLQKMASALRNTPLHETEAHIRNAQQALERGDRARAASELRQAAASAQREMQQARDQEGVRQSQATLQQSQDEMAAAAKPKDISDSPGQPSGRSSRSQQTPSSQEKSSTGQTSQDKPQSGQAGQGESTAQTGRKSPGESGSGKPGQQDQGQSAGERSGEGQSASQGASSQSDSGQTESSQGLPGNEGTGRGGPNRPEPGQYSPGTEMNPPTPKQHRGVFHGAPHPLSPNFHPADNPKYGQLYLGSPAAGGKYVGRTLPGSSPQAGHAAVSHVPYVPSLKAARKQAETAMDREEIPPAYRGSVRQYFNALPSK